MRGWGYKFDSGSPPASGALTLIESVELASAVATITFADIPQTYKHLLLMGVFRGDVAANNTVLALRANGDSGANYDYSDLGGNGSVAYAAQATGTTQPQVGQIAGQSAPANQVGGMHLFILDYTDTNHKKNAHGQSTLTFETNNNLYMEQFFWNWRDTSAITSLILFGQSGNMIAPTRVELYGIS